jgi:hypothetical protein
MLFLPLSLSLQAGTLFAADAGSTADPAVAADSTAVADSTQARGGPPYLGFVAWNISDADLLRNDIYSTHSGVRVYYIDPGSPAYEARLGVNDLVTHVNGAPVYSWQQLGSEVEKAGIGSVVDLRVLREGEERTVELTTVEWPTGYLGFEVVPLCDADSVRAELPQELAALDSLPVVSWVHGEIGELAHAGLTVGSEIVSLNGDEIRSPADLASTSKYIGLFGDVELGFYRDGEKHGIRYYAQMSPQPWSGLELEKVTPLLVEVESLTVAVDEAPGLWVSKVEGGSPAEEAGIKPRDFLVSVDGRKLSDTQELKDYYAGIPLGPNQGVDIVVYRECGGCDTTSSADISELAGGAETVVSSVSQSGGGMSEGPKKSSTTVEKGRPSDPNTFTARLKRSSRLKYVHRRDTYQPFLRLTTSVGHGGHLSARAWGHLGFFGDRGLSVDTWLSLPHWSKVTGPRWYLGAHVRPSSRHPNAGFDIVADYGQDDESWHYYIPLYFGKPWLPGFEYVNRPEPFANERISNMPEATLFGFFGGEDNQNYTHVEGVRFYKTLHHPFRRGGRPGHRLHVNLGFLKHSTMKTVARASWVSGRQSYSENPVEGVATGRINTFHLSYSYDVYNPNRWSGLDFYAYSRFGGGLLGGDHEFAKYGGSLEGSLRLWSHFYFDSQAEGGFGTGSLPLQEEYYVGGKGTLPGFQDRQFSGDRLVRFSQRFSLGTTPESDEILGRIQYRVFAGIDAATAWDSDKTSTVPNLEWDYIIGVALPATFEVIPNGDLWFAGARPFDSERGDWRFMMGIFSKM